MVLRTRLPLRKAVLKEDSDKYFVQFVAPLITKAQMMATMKGSNWTPRGKGSLNKKEGRIDGLVDFTGEPYRSPMTFSFSGSYMTAGDGQASIYIKQTRGMSHEDRFKLTGNPANDAKKMMVSLKELCEDMSRA